MSTLEHATPPAPDRLEPFRQLLVLGLAVALAAAALGFLLLRDGGGRPAGTNTPTLVSAEELQRLAASADQPVYWAGPREDFSYELTRSRSGRIYVRYLPAGVAAGDARANFLVVGTYARPGSFADLKRAASREGSAMIERQNGAIVVFASARPTNVYLSHPGASYQVEVYSPDPATAKRLLLSGAVRPIRY